MKKKILLLFTLVVCFVLSALAAKVISDSCGKCSVSVNSNGAVSYTCGKCSSNECSMRLIQYGENSVTYSATCSGCGHSMSFSSEVK